MGDPCCVVLLTLLYSATSAGMHVLRAPICNTFEDDRSTPYYIISLQQRIGYHERDRTR